MYPHIHAYIYIHTYACVDLHINLHFTYTHRTSALSVFYIHTYIHTYIHSKCIIRINVYSTYQRCHSEAIMETGFTETYVHERPACVHACLLIVTMWSPILCLSPRMHTHIFINTYVYIYICTHTCSFLLHVHECI